MFYGVRLGFVGIAANGPIRGEFRRFENPHGLAANMSLPCTTRRHEAIFFISTGRCATQWFADKLSRYYGDLAVVEHEPYSAEYEPRFHFRAWHQKQNIKFSDAIEQRLSFVKNTLETKHYVETGWPAFGALPFLLQRLEGCVRVVHLYRHPLNAAASLATHRVYDRGEWSDAVAISPADDGVVQRELEGDRWATISQFEKCLFWWTELNSYAIRLRRTFARTPWLSLKYEDVFSQNGRGELARLLEFLGLPERESFFRSQHDRTDAYRTKTDEAIEPSKLQDYPKALELMHFLGYDQDDRAERCLHQRYVSPFLRKMGHKLKRLLRRFRGVGRGQSITKSTPL